MKRILNLLLLLAVFATATAQSTFQSALKAKAKANIYGVVECDGKPVAGVPVSDGYQIVLTNKKGQYALQSEKKNGNVSLFQAVMRL